MPTWNPATLTLSNSFLSARLEPRHGGRLVSLIGPAGELTRAADAASLAGTRVPYKFGLLSLQLWQDSYWHNDLCHLTWPIANTVAGANAVDVTLSGTSMLWQGVTVARTYHLTDDPWIDVRHSLDPGTKTLPYLPPAFWFGNTMRGRGHTFVSGPTGVVDLPRYPQDQSWCQEPTDGWLAWIGRGGGLAFVTEPEQLRHVRVGHLEVDQVDWIRRRVDTVQQAVVRLIPFRGLSRVDGVGSAGVVSARVTRTGIWVDLYPIRTGRATAAIWSLSEPPAKKPIPDLSD
jgi:hypothetical protein